MVPPAPPLSTDQVKAGWLAERISELIQAGCAEGIGRVVRHRRRPGLDHNARQGLTTVTLTLLVVESPPASVIVTWKL